MGLNVTELIRALALVLVIEGLLPFLLPARWREAMRAAAGLDTRTLRLLGLASMIVGLLILKSFA